MLATGAVMLAVALSGTGSYVKLTTSTTFIEEGTPFTVDIYAGAHVPVNAVDITLRFPSDVVSVREIDTGRSVITLWAQEPAVVGDSVVLQGGTFRRGFVGEHLIASIDLEAKVSGEAAFTLTDITLLAGDGSGSVVALSESGSQTDAVVQIGAKDGELRGDIALIITTDIDGDGNVTLADIQSFMAAWRGQGTTYDFNNDNRMTFTDFAIILAHSFMR
jgi:hypothetical protein